MRYLLGMLPEDEMRRLEEKYFADDEVYEDLEATERDLLDSYTRDELSEGDRKRFEEYFLCSTERRARLGFAITLQRYLTTPVLQQLRPPSRPLTGWRLVFAPSNLRAAALVAVIGLGAFAFWRLFLYESDIERALAALNLAYREQRPTESRITGFDYAPLPNVRGTEIRIDRRNRDFAERLLLEEVIADPTSEAHHAVGRLYLAEAKIDQAIAELEEALKRAPSNARILSDLGAAWLEKGNSSALPTGSGERLEALGRSLHYLNQALDLDNVLLEAIFNRALCYEDLLMPKAARTEWKRYVEIDSNSNWADEARKRLTMIEEKEGSQRDPEKPLRDFIAAYHGSNPEEAADAFARGHNAAGNLIVERLVDDYLTLAGQRAQPDVEKSLRMLSYAAELVTQRTGDPYFRELCAYYGYAKADRLGSVRAARRLRQEASEKYKRAKFQEAVDLFVDAAQAFRRGGNDWEGWQVQYRTALACLRQAEVAKALSILREVERHCREANYAWLLGRVLNLIADAYITLNWYSEALRYSKQALDASKLVRDSYYEVRSGIQIAVEYWYLGNCRGSLTYLQRCMDVSQASVADPDQLRLLYDVAAACLASLGLFAPAVDYQEEAIRVSIESGSPLLESRSYANLAAIYGRMKKYSDAISSAHRSYEIGRSLQSEEAVGRGMMAWAALQLGDLYRESGDQNKAIAAYDEYIEFYQDRNVSAETVEAYKGKHLSYAIIGENTAAESELQNALRLLEHSRSRIEEESNRNIFADSSQGIYDIAIDFAYMRMNQPQRAFEFAEASRGRVLLDLIAAGGRIVEAERGPDLHLPAVAASLDLFEIQTRLPDETQLLQYAALDKTLLIWVVSKDDVSVAEQRINLDDLTRKVLVYLGTISRESGDPEEAARYGRELYDVLVKPVEERLDRNKYLCIVPDKILNYLPFGALISADSNRYLIEDYLIGYSPSSSVFISCCERARSKTAVETERVLTVGDPSFDRGAFPGLRELPDAGKEATVIARLYQSARLLTRDKAGEPDVRAAWQNADVIHLATHYVVEESAPLLSKLLLAKPAAASGRFPEDDGALQPWEIYSSKPTRARLVVLSACQTGIERSYRGEGAVGISRPFIASEVPLVVATLWPVDSTATSELMIGLHKYRKLGGLSSAESLRRAQLDMLHGANVSYRQPYYWGSFTINGGHATF